MSKRQFIKLAALLRQNRHAFANDYAWEHFCCRLADMCASENPRFQRQRFLRACTDEVTA